MAPLFFQRGEKNNFGYDPIFVPNGHANTFAEMTSEEKNQISHRSQALTKFVDDIFI